MHLKFDLKFNLFIFHTQNRLEVYVDSVIVSVERAYQLFLADKSDSSNKLTLAEYLVYSHFARVGCNLRKFTEEKKHYVDQTNSSSTSSSISSDNLYVWNYLYELLGHQKRVIILNDHDETTYRRVKSSMDDVVQNFRTSQPIEMKNETDIRKRQLECESPISKKFIKLAHRYPEDNEQYFGSGSTNDFMIGNEFEKFRDIFQKIDIIEMKNIENDTQLTNLKFSFDLWISTDYQRTKFLGPNFRIIVR